MDISGGGFDPFDSLTAIYMWEADEIFNADYSILTTLQYNTRHNGVYGDYLMVGMGAEKPGISSFKIQVLPNPASCILNIYITDRTEGAMGLSIYDSYGRLAYKAIIPAGQQQVKLDIENWPVGIYFARGQAEALFAETAKFIITK